MTRFRPTFKALRQQQGLYPLVGIQPSGARPDRFGAIAIPFPRLIPRRALIGA